MSSELNIYYDEEGDFLELNIGGYTEGHFKNLGDGIWQVFAKPAKKLKIGDIFFVADDLISTN